jgi:hypothetical protein
VRMAHPTCCSPPPNLPCASARRPLCQRGLVNVCPLWPLSRIPALRGTWTPVHRTKGVGRRPGDFEMDSTMVTPPELCMRSTPKSDNTPRCMAPGRIAQCPSLTIGRLRASRKHHTEATASGICLNRIRSLVLCNLRTSTQQNGKEGAHNQCAESCRHDINVIRLKSMPSRCAAVSDKLNGEVFSGLG